MKRNILIIGAGAVGLVYGKYFVDAGNKLTFYVREKYIDALSKGSILYNLNKDKKKKNPIHFTEYELVCSFKEIGEQEWDQVYFCISSTAFLSFDLEDLKDNLRGKPSVVLLQPNAADFNYLSSIFPVEQIVDGMITLISYQAPLSTETVPAPGIAYWLPPFAPTPFSGEPSRRDDIVQTFKDGKMNASPVESAIEKALFPTAALSSFLIALEASNWEFSVLKKNKKALRHLSRATDEVYTSLEREYSVKRPKGIDWLSKPFVLKQLLRFMTTFMPMDMETYLKYHFLKVNDQTKLYMSNYVKKAEKHGVEHKHLIALNAMLKME